MRGFELCNSTTRVVQTTRPVRGSTGPRGFPGPSGTGTYMAVGYYIVEAAAAVSPGSPVPFSLTPQGTSVGVTSYGGTVFGVVHEGVYSVEFSIAVTGPADQLYGAHLAVNNGTSVQTFPTYTSLGGGVVYGSQMLHLTPNDRLSIVVSAPLTMTITSPLVTSSTLMIEFVGNPNPTP